MTVSFSIATVLYGMLMDFTMTKPWTNFAR